MSDTQCISMAMIKLASSVKCFLEKIVYDVNLGRCPPILSHELKDILNEKYVSAYYIDDLLD